jgi:hypothetical protein
VPASNLWTAPPPPPDHRTHHALPCAAANPSLQGASCWALDTDAKVCCLAWTVAAGVHTLMRMHACVWRGVTLTSQHQSFKDWCRAAPPNPQQVLSSSKAPNCIQVPPEDDSQLTPEQLAQLSGVTLAPEAAAAPVATLGASPPTAGMGSWDGRCRPVRVWRYTVAC